jgi:putative membrane protein
MSLLADAGDFVAHSGWFHHSSQWGWAMMTGFWLLVIITVALLVRGVGGSRVDAEPTRNARSILNERYARGEIDEAELRERLAVLGGQ